MVYLCTKAEIQQAQYTLDTFCCVHSLHGSGAYVLLSGQDEGRTFGTCRLHPGKWHQSLLVRRWLRLVDGVAEAQTAAISMVVAAAEAIPVGRIVYAVLLTKTEWKDLSIVHLTARGAGAEAWRLSHAEQAR